MHEEPFNTIVLCPRCFQPNLKVVHEFSSGWLTRPKRFCEKCGYAGFLVLEIEKSEYLEIPEENREKIIKEMFIEGLEEDENFDEDER